MIKKGKSHPLQDPANKNDVWSSEDGVTWTEETSGATWSGRYTPEAIPYDNKIWIMGGNNGVTAQRDIYASEEAINVGISRKIGRQATFDR